MLTRAAISLIHFNLYHEHQLVVKCLDKRLALHRRGQGYDVCGPRVYTVVNPRPDFENFVLKDQNGLAGKLSFLGEEIDVGDWVTAELVSSLKWYPDVTTTTELLGLAIQGCARDELLRYGLRINNMNQLYGGTPVSLAAG